MIHVIALLFFSVGTSLGFSTPDFQGLLLKEPWYTKNSTAFTPENRQCQGSEWQRETENLRRMYPDPKDQQFLWYCTTYELREDLSENYSLNLGVVGDTDVTFIDGIPVGSFGLEKPYSSVGIHHYRSYRLWAPALKKGPHTLEIRVRQTDGVSGGINDADEIAILPVRESNMKAWRHNFLRSFLPFGLAIAVLFVGAYYGILALITQRDKRYYYFVSLCFAVTLYNAMFSYFFTEIIANPNLELIMGTISTVWGLHFLYSFIRESQRRSFDHWDRISLGVAIAVTLAFIISPSIDISQIIYFAWFPWLISFLGYAGYVFFKASIRVKAWDTMLIFFLFVFFAGSCIYDAVMATYEPEVIFLSSYGYSAFTISLNLLLAKEHGYALSDRRKKVILEHENVRLKTLADIDSLSQVNNRRSFFEALTEQMQIHKDHQKSVSLLILDIDHFKRFNDAYGHPEGDILIKQFAQTVSEAMRPNDLVGRLGGEEFGVMLMDSTEETAFVIGERIRMAVKSNKKMRHHKDGQKVTVSVGVAEMSMNDDQTQLYEKADNALYVAKQTRNCTIRYSHCPKKA